MCSIACCVFVHVFILQVLHVYVVCIGLLLFLHESMYWYNVFFCLSYTYAYEIIISFDVA
jgi:hypothetical protein